MNASIPAGIAVTEGDPAIVVVTNPALLPYNNKAKPSVHDELIGNKHIADREWKRVEAVRKLTVSASVYLVITVVVAMIENAHSYFMNNLGFLTYGALEAGLLLTVVYMKKSLRCTGISISSAVLLACVAYSCYHLFLTDLTTAVVCGCYDIVSLFFFLYQTINSFSL